MTRNQPLLLALLTSSLLGIAGCASAPSRTPEAQPDDLAELKARVVELQRKATVSEAEVGRLRQQVTDLEARLGVRPASGQTAAPSAAPPRPSTAPPVAPTTGTATPSLAAPRPAAPKPAPPRGQEIEEVDLDAPPIAARPAPAQAPAPPPARPATP
ncbi:MAG TPA: hypothetical protein VN851_12335, partial [Thermoanaerobaculia bacterium]|nr:hypothetical protein [Thermoanaerobaculia bacterium]